MAVKDPSQWPTAQRDFRKRFAVESPNLPRQRVHYRVVGGGQVRFGYGMWAVLLPIAWAVRRVGAKRMFNEDALIAVWPAEAASGDEASLVFEFDTPSPEAEGEATLVGEFEPNGCLCLEAGDGSTIWPTYNPRRPLRAAPRR